MHFVFFSKKSFKIPFKQMDVFNDFFNMSGNEFHKFAPGILKINPLIFNFPEVTSIWFT